MHYNIVSVFNHEVKIPAIIASVKYLFACVFPSKNPWNVNGRALTDVERSRM